MNIYTSPPPRTNVFTILEFFKKIILRIKIFFFNDPSVVLAITMHLLVRSNQSEFIQN